VTSLPVDLGDQLARRPGWPACPSTWVTSLPVDLG